MSGVWDASCERRAKELLFRFLEELGATKAALYLLEKEGAFKLAAQYGFGRRDSLVREIPSGHALLDWVRRNRTSPAFLNNAHEDPGLADVVVGAGTAHLLTLPIVISGRLVGFVDARDKGRKALFNAEDIPRARAVGEAIEAFLRELGLYGSTTQARESASPQVPSPPRKGRDEAPARLHHEIIEELAAISRCCARLPDVAAIALSLTDGASVRGLMLRTVPFDSQQREALATHQARQFQEEGVRVPAPGLWAWSEEESGGCESHARQITTAVIHRGPPIWIVLSVLTSGTREASEPVLAAVGLHVRLALQAQRYRRATRNLARVLLEPGEQGLPQLRHHSQAVSELSQRIAAALDLEEEEEELVTIAGYLHDVGMRELEYARIYRAERIGEVERRLFRRHPMIGARILEGGEFPGDLAAAVRHHHERWDGEGYPDRLSGEAIPLASRIVHLAEVWDVLTSASSYRRPVGREEALEIIRGEAGKQFDPRLVPVLAEVISA